MRYENVCLQAWAHELPPEVVTSAALEDRLAPVYAGLGLPAGRLELMTGIRERRFWPAPVSPGEVSARTARAALERSGLAPGRIGAVVHGSVCRDFLEPATANLVAHALGVARDATVLDVSNACLGVLSGMILVANMIELGQIEAGLVVSTEDGRPLVDTTVRDLLARHARGELTRKQVKPALASLTIGSASVAIVLCSRGAADAARGGHRLLGGTVAQAAEHHGLCRSTPDRGFQPGAGEDEPLLMQTDSETMLQHGCALAARNWSAFLAELGWAGGTPRKVFCHQVGVAHRRALFQALALDASRDYPTVERFGNTGSAALPLGLALAADEGLLAPGDPVALLGIGSGLNSIMLGVTW